MCTDKIDTHNGDMVSAVMGDIGKGLYVAEDVVPIYRGMLEIATMVTPNAFELE